MPTLRRSSKPLLCLTALISLCYAILLLRAPQIIGDGNPVNAVNFELLDRVLTTEQPKDPRFHSQLGQDKWVSESMHACMHACTCVQMRIGFA